MSAARSLEIRCQSDTDDRYIQYHNHVADGGCRKATITNMGAELGATTSMFPADEKMARYLNATGRAALVPLVAQHRELLIPDAEVEQDPEKYYDRVIRLDLGTLEPYVVGPHTPDRARPISAFAAELKDKSNGFVDRISSTLIGSCTNSSYEDMSRAADVAEQAAAQGLGRIGGLPAMSARTRRASCERRRAGCFRWGELQAARGALEQRGANLVFQRAKLLAQWRLLNSQSLRGTRSPGPLRPAQ